MSAILMSFDYSRKIAINGISLSSNTFKAEMLLNPDGDWKLSQKYGQLRMTLTGDSAVIKDMTLSDIEKWLSDAVIELAGSQVAPHDE